MTMQKAPQMSSIDMQTSGTVIADLNYIKPEATIAPEVFYSGGDAPQNYNDAYAFMPANIEDGRASSENFQIHTHGFQLVKAATQATNFEDEHVIEGAYYDEIKAIVRDVTGAQDVFVFDHTVRLGKTNSRRKP